jgi:hypothetical protein
MKKIKNEYLKNLINYSKRVVISGIGIVSPIGCNIKVNFYLKESLFGKI